MGKEFGQKTTVIVTVNKNECLLHLINDFCIENNRSMFNRDTLIFKYKKYKSRVRGSYATRQPHQIKIISFCKVKQSAKNYTENNKKDCGSKIKLQI